MTKLDYCTLEELVELDNLLNNDNNTVNDWLDVFNDEAKEELINEISTDILSKGYDGDNNYQSMFWFAKGLNIPKPSQPKRYVDSEEYKRRQQKKADEELFKKLPKPSINDPLIDFYHENLKKKFDRDIHKRNEEFLKQLRAHADRLREFNRFNTTDASEAADFFEKTSYAEDNKQRMKTFKEFIEASKYQEDIIDGLMESLESTPNKWLLSFEELNNEGRHLLFPRLKQFFKDFIDPLPATEQYKFAFNVNGQWYSKPFTPELYNQLMENFHEENLIFNLDDRPPEYFYEKGSMKLPEWSLFSAISIEPVKQKKTNDRGGKFFPYVTTEDVPQVLIDYLKRLQIFDKLTDDELTKHEDEKFIKKGYYYDKYEEEMMEDYDYIPEVNKYKYTQRKELDDCCFIYALQQTGCYDEGTLNKIRLRINNRYLSQSSVDDLCKEFKIHIKLTYIDENCEGKNKKKTIESAKGGNRKSYMGIKEAEPNRTHNMNIFEKHYFLEEMTQFSNYYIKHLREVIKLKDSDIYINKEWNKDHYRKTRCFIKSGNLVRELMKNGFFKPITFGQYHILNTIYHHDIKNTGDFDLAYDEEACTQLIAPIPAPPIKRSEKKTNPTYWYCDFEADVSGKVHKPFMCVLQSLTGRINKEFRGENCNKQLLDFLPDESIIYFHNLAYDIRMLAKYGISKSIIKGTKVMKGDINYGDKKLHFKDTLPILSCKLSELPKMFHIPDIQKEIFPYKYYTLERLETNQGIISEAGALEDKIWMNEDYELFNENIDKIPGCRIDENHFDMWKYASFYCQQDVNILRLGFNEFRKGFIKDFQIDPFNFISISSLANEVFNQRVYYPNKNLYKLGGHVRQFCSQAVYGGRCMCAYNRKWHVKTPLSDFDAVSLYPSAMARLYTVEGRPKVIQPEQLNMEFLSKQSAYIVEINITKVNKHYAFPLIVRKVNGLNLNDDSLAEGETVKMVVDNITLEDLINFQQIEFTLIKGYYWDGKRDYTIQKEIRRIFEKRVEYKKEKNPLQLLYKLVMNSCYGKTIERPVDKDYKYLHEGDELDNYWYKNYNKIVEDVKLDNSEIHAVKTLKPIDKHFNFSLLGIQVLSMSKRIMNEVMCLAFDLGCHIYYQDTDSMHIEVDDLPKLEKAFEEKYNRKLVGSNMGQFHSDFEADNGRDDVKYAVESVFLMKKMYIDRLLMSDNTYENMIRGKGLTLNSIRYAADKWHHGNVLEMYKYMYNGKEQTFDLTKGQPCMKLNNNMSVSTLNKFNRKIEVKYEPGNRNDYFNYSTSIDQRSAKN